MTLRTGWWALLILVSIVLIGELSLTANRYEGWVSHSDFIEYWSAGQLLLRDRNPYDSEALYAVEKEVGWSKNRPLVMWNPPWLLALLYPLLLLPYEVAAMIWFGLSLGVLLGCTVLIWRFFVPLTSPLELLAPLLATVIFIPAPLTLYTGQISVLILLGIVGFLHLERRGRDFWAGASLVLLTFKPHLAYLLWIAIVWWVITRRRGKVLWGLGSTLLVLCGLLTLFRPTWALDYVDTMQHPPLHWRTPVLGTALRILFGWDRTWLQYLPTLIVGPLVLFALYRRRAAYAWRDTAGPLLLLSVPTAAYGWSFDQLVLLLPYLQVVAWLRAHHHRDLTSSLVVATGLLATNGLTFGVNRKFRDDLYLLWGPLVWGLLYLTARWALGRQWLGTVPAACGEERA